jgi:hypothetical protein
MTKNVMTKMLWQKWYDKNGTTKNVMTKKVMTKNVMTKIVMAKMLWQKCYDKNGLSLRFVLVQVPRKVSSEITKCFSSVISYHRPLHQCGNFPRRVRIRVTGCARGKNRPKGSPTHFCQNQYTHFTVVTFSPKSLGYFSNFRKPAQSKQLRNRQTIAQSDI